MIDKKNIIETLKKKFSLKTKVGQIVRKNFEARRKEKKDRIGKMIIEDIQNNRNHTWIEEVYARNKNTLDDPAIFYRGTEVTYKEMFETMREYAKSLKSLGVERGTEIPICMSNTPELIYLLGAISMIGAKANIFNDEFDPDYITEIIDGCNADIMFVEDRKYSRIKDSIDKSHISRIFMTSLTTSLPKEGNPYEEYDRKHGQFVNTIDLHKENNPFIRDINEFVELGKDYQGELLCGTGLDDEFTITYSSGSTNSSRAKAIVHTNRSYVTLGRCHDPEIQKTASMKHFTIQAQIPPHSNTQIISGISSTLMQGSKIALEPIYDKDFFIDALKINNPTYCLATRSFWVNAMKKVLYDPKYKGTTFPKLLIAFSVGEPLEKNEEKLINRGLRKSKAAKDIIPTPISPVTVSVAGGDCEHGGVFYIIFRALQSKKPTHMFKKDPHGMRPFEMVETAILDENGNRLGPNKLGRMVANSPCNMKCYKNNQEATEKFFVTDAEGKVWGDCNVYAYVDEYDNVYMKGRIPTQKEEIPTFIISDAILKDTKNILSCETIKDEETGYYIAHIEFQPGKRKGELDTILGAERRCLKVLGDDFTSRIVYRIHSNEESFILTGCGKRNNHALIDEGLSDKCVKPVEVGYDGEYKLQPIVDGPKVYKK